MTEAGRARRVGERRCRFGPAAIELHSCVAVDGRTFYMVTIDAESAMTLPEDDPVRAGAVMEAVGAIRDPAYASERTSGFEFAANFAADPAGQAGGVEGLGRVAEEAWEILDVAFLLPYRAPEEREASDARPPAPSQAAGRFHARMPVVGTGEKRGRRAIMATLRKRKSPRRR